MSTTWASSASPRSDSFYEPCTHLDIVRRAMRNLQVGFEKLQEPAKAEEVAQLLAILLEKNDDFNGE
ncbi:MAG: hypothetical protein WKG07_49685 [Hymenobacter sp.]